MLVAEEGLARLVAAPTGDRLFVVPRARRRRARGWAKLDADRVVESLVGAGPGAVILARGHDGDPEASALPALGRMMGRDVVRLSDDPVIAAWAIAVAVHRDFQGEGLVRRLEVIVGLTCRTGPLPGRRVESGAVSVPVLRPGVLSKWATRAWRSCRRCPGGGPEGGRCGRCGTSVTAAVQA
jgi:hypothetical protein